MIFYSASASTVGGRLTQRPEGSGVRKLYSKKCKCSINKVFIDSSNMRKLQVHIFMLWCSLMRNSHIEKTNLLFSGEYLWIILQKNSGSACTYSKHFEMLGKTKRTLLSSSQVSEGENSIYISIQIGIACLFWNPV